MLRITVTVSLFLFAIAGCARDLRLMPLSAAHPASPEGEEAPTRPVAAMLTSQDARVRGAGETATGSPRVGTHGARGAHGGDGHAH